MSSPVPRSPFRPENARPSASPSSPRFWSNLVRYVAALLAVAVGAAAFAVVFRGAINLVFARVYRADDVLTAFESLPWYGCVVGPAVGAGGAGLMSFFASRLKGGGGVEVMEAVVLGNVRISLRSTALKAFGSWLAIISGGSVGREGSIIQFGGGLGGVIGRTFGLHEGQVRGLIAAGSAAGFAAAYNTPLAAVLFVVEVVTGVIALDVVLPAIIVTPIATMLARQVVGGGPIYGQRSFVMGPDSSLLLPALPGLVAGVAGPAFRAFLRSPFHQVAPAETGAGGARWAVCRCVRHRHATDHGQWLRGDQLDFGRAGRLSTDVGAPVRQGGGDDRLSFLGEPRRRLHARALHRRGDGRCGR